MAKRLTDTEKFIDPWYRRLSTKHKLLWDWLLCNCDHAGIVTVDFEFIEMVLSEKYEDNALDEYFSDRVIKLGHFKYFIPKFLRFQYGKLNPLSKVHASVIQRLKDEGILYNDSDSIKEIENNARVIEYGKGLDTVIEKNKNKAKEKIKDKEEEKEESEDKKNLSEKDSQVIRKITPDEVVHLWNVSGLGKTNGYFQNLGSNKHLKNCLDAIQFLPDEKSWVELFDKVKSSGFLMGENDRGWHVPLTWLVDYDNAIRIISNEFDSEKWKKNLFASMKTEESA